MRKQLAAVALAGAVGVVAGAALVSLRGTGPEPVAPPAPVAAASPPRILAELIGSAEDGRLAPGDADTVARAVDSLAQILDAEIAERRVLAEELQLLRAELDDLEQNLPERLLDAAGGEGAISFSMTRAATDSPDNAPPRPVSRAERFAELGFAPEQVEQFQRREAEMTMARVELDDRARREGWANSPRYAEEFRRLADSGDPIRSELGDDAYDRYLVAMGRPNRVVVGRVIPTSPAEQAGLRAGDVVLRYGGARVFSTPELTNARSMGERGEAVTVEIIREGQPMQITMPRGPMGINTFMNSVDPAARPGG